LIDPVSITAVLCAAVVSAWRKEIGALVWKWVARLLAKKPEYTIVAPSGAQFRIDPSEELTESRIDEIRVGLNKPSPRTVAGR
jgi:hypothetical protein